MLYDWPGLSKILMAVRVGWYEKAKKIQMKGYQLKQRNEWTGFLQ